jgi:hypothetical protein
MKLKREMALSVVQIHAAHTAFCRSIFWIFSIRLLSSLYKPTEEINGKFPQMLSKID